MIWRSKAIRACKGDRCDPDEIRPMYRFGETCQETAPQALMAFFESTDFEDAISVGGDSDTLAAITGGVAEVCCGIP